MTGTCREAPAACWTSAELIPRQVSKLKETISPNAWEERRAQKIKHGAAYGSGGEPRAGQGARRCIAQEIQPQHGESGKYPCEAKKAREKAKSTAKVSDEQ